MSIYDFEYTSIEGKQVSLKDYEGKVLLIVNTASKCGFTPQYEGLEELYKTYGEQGLVVLGFPCNQFAEQEPGGSEQIQEFCKLRYGVTFPLSQKVDVRGETAVPLFKHLCAQKGYEGLGKGMKAAALNSMFKKIYGKDGAKDDQVKWNFTKFLVDREGNVVGRFEPTVEPEKMKSAIEACL